jgi:hypothetical protein
MMPAFGFCASPDWPRGELNLPRALVTEKAFPENEAVMTFTGSNGSVEHEFLYERRIGPRTQFKIAVPLAATQDAVRWTAGFGDVAVALKRAVFHRLRPGTIISAAAEVVLPTGDFDRGLGKGATIVEPFVAWGQILPADSFFQLQSGAELSADRDRAENEAFLRTVIEKTFTEGRFGRSWSPMIEVLGTRELGDNHPMKWDIVPQLQVSLSRRQHILVNAGVRLPVSDTGGATPKEIRRPDDVQIYESVMVDSRGEVTTGLLSGSAYAKDNRLLPEGFDKRTAPPDIAVHGRAATDDDFSGRGDRVRYMVDVSGSRAPFRVEVALRYQPIGFRWAENLKAYDAPEPRRFVGYYESMAAQSSAPLALAAAEIQ